MKQVVKATIYNRHDEIISIGYNDITNEEVTECPRADIPTGEGYHLCKEVCGQLGHAEVVALKNAGNRDLTECYIKLKGHTYACDACRSALLERGISVIIIEGE
jgi:deoxycytidylate deaminase